MKVKNLPNFFLTFLLFPLFLFSQQTSTVTIFGTVSDKTFGEGLAGVLVEVISEADSSERATALSDSGGAYTLTLSLSAGQGEETPEDFALMQNYPNPFNPSTLIPFQIPQASPVSLDIYNILGQKVRTLVKKQLPAGRYVAEWDGRSDAGAGVSAGIYIYRLKAADFTQARKMVLLDGASAGAMGTALPALRPQNAANLFHNLSRLQVTVRATSPWIETVEQKQLTITSSPFQLNISANRISSFLDGKRVVVSEPGRNRTVYVSGLPGAVIETITGREWVTVRNPETGALDSTTVQPHGGFFVMELPASNRDHLLLSLTRDEQLLGSPLNLLVPDSEPPLVIGSKPTNGDKDIIIDDPIIVYFSEPADTNTVTGNSFFLTDSLGVALPGSFEFMKNNTVALLDPFDPLMPDSRYTITVTSAVTDLQGLHLESAFTATFFTQILALGNIIRVPQDRPTIQAGINAAGDGDVVLVDEGTYTENINFKGKAITVASYYILDQDTNHINNTIIDGSQPGHPDSGSVVYFITGEDTSSVLYGFSITGGTGTVWNYPGYPTLIRAGGGVFMYPSGGRISDNKIFNNSITYEILDGVGILAEPVGDQKVIIENNNIHSNHGYKTQSSLSATGAIEVWPEGNNTILIRNNKIHNNTLVAQGGYGRGGGIFCGGFTSANAVAVISGNSVINNTIQPSQASNSNAAAGIQLFRIEAKVFNNIIRNNRFIGNYGWGGGIQFAQKPAEFYNNIVADNFAQHGGGVSLYKIPYDSLIFVNNTITGNTAGYQGGGIFTSEMDGLVLNSILWNNSAPNRPEIFVWQGSITVRYSDVQGGWSGEGNIDADPLLVADSLSNSSPCISAGTLQYDFGGGVVLLSPPDDINGRMRPYPAGSNPDMGAWESKF